MLFRPVRMLFSTLIYLAELAKSHSRLLGRAAPAGVTVISFVRSTVLPLPTVMDSGSESAVTGVKLSFSGFSSPFFVLPS